MKVKCEYDLDGIKNILNKKYRKNYKVICRRRATLNKGS